MQDAPLHRQSNPMRRLQKRKLKQRLSSFWMIAALALVASLAVYKTFDVYQKYSESKKNVDGLSAEYQHLEIRKGELESRIFSLQSESGIEGEIREKFNVAKEGEEVLIIIDPKEENTAEVENKSDLSLFWDKISSFFRK